MVFGPEVFERIFVGILRELAERFSLRLDAREHCIPDAFQVLDLEPRRLSDRTSQHLFCHWAFSLLFKAGQLPNRFGTRYSVSTMRTTILRAWLLDTGIGHGHFGKAFSRHIVTRVATSACPTTNSCDASVGRP